MARTAYTLYLTCSLLNAVNKTISERLGRNVETIGNMHIFNTDALFQMANQMDFRNFAVIDIHFNGLSTRQHTRTHSVGYRMQTTCLTLHRV